MADGSIYRSVGLIFFYFSKIFFKNLFLYGKNIWPNRRNGSRPIRRKNRFPAAKQPGNGTVIPANEPKAAPGIERIGRPLIARLRKSTGDFLCDGGSGRPQNGVRRVSQGSFQRPCAKNRPAGVRRARRQERNRRPKDKI
nr:hypothetical protein [Bacillaceae bacterium]